MPSKHSKTLLSKGLQVPDNYRIYCILPNVVQCPVYSQMIEVGAKANMLKVMSTPETRTVVQPAGRVLTQGEHVVSRMRDYVLRRHIYNYVVDGGKIDPDDPFFSELCQPLTTINLRVRDTFELYHVANMLRYFDIEVYQFHDTDQPDYGDRDMKVLTAICTEPLDPASVNGILDYLPLWKPDAQG